MKVKHISSLISIILIFSSCAYFNTFYNAQVLFQNSQKLYNESEDKNNLNRASRDALESAALKARKVIDKFPDSRYVDDSMFFFGVTNYQLGKYYVSKQMFTRLISEFPESPFYAESNLWIARCNYRMGETDLAFSRIEDFIGDAKNQAFIADALILAGQLSHQQGDTVKALSYYQDAAKSTRNREKRSAALYELALFQIERKNYDSALQALTEIQDISVDRELMGKVQLLFARIYRLTAHYEKSQQLIREMLADQEKQAIFGELELELAQTYLNLGEYDRALERYNSIIETYNRKPEAAKAAYHLGEIFLFQKSDFEKAKQYFNQVRSHNSSGVEVFKAQSRVALIENYEQANKKKKLISDKNPELLSNPYAYYQMLKDSAAVDSSFILKLSNYSKEADQYINQQMVIAELLAFSLALNDSALSIYKMLTDSFSFSPKMPHVYSAWGWILQEELKRMEEGQAIFDYLLVEYPESRFARQLSDTAGYGLDNTGYKLAQKAMYRIENELIDKGMTGKALKELKVLSSEYTDSLSQAHILAQIAWLFDHQLVHLDSALYYYGQIADKYPLSDFGKMSKSRIISLSEILEMTNFEKPDEEDFEMELESRADTKKDSIKAAPDSSGEKNVEEE
ncbi:MAG TPA: tetratricopeptide repeat protein [Candidatus Marinimicrobia bacterium]|nr:tetratricopeptide repeat protein [Candidatus Neomarinimicrobiota bacterium]